MLLVVMPGAPSSFLLLVVPHPSISLRTSPRHVRVNLSEDCRINPSELEGPPPAQRRRLRTESI